MIESRLGGILQPEKTWGFVEEFQKSLADKMARVESADALMLLNGIKEELHKELSAGNSVITLKKLVHRHLPEVNPG